MRPKALLIRSVMVDRYLYDLAKISEPQVKPSQLARALGIRVVTVPNLIEAGHLATVNGQTTIAVRASHREKQFVIAHELAHFAGIEDEDEADIAAASLVCRSPFGGTWSELAERHGTSETLIALRWAEVTGEPCAVVSPHRVRSRGFAAVPEVIRGWVRRPIPGVRSVRLRDDRKRFAAVAAAVA